MAKNHKCSNCGAKSAPILSNYRYTESGLGNVVLQNVHVAGCSLCGGEDVVIPHLERIHQAIAGALIESPARLTGAELRFLRKHLGKSGEQLAKYLHTDKTKISKWEQGVDPIGPSTDRLIRMLVAALDPELAPQSARIAEHLREISDKPLQTELHIDAETLRASYLPVRDAA